MSSNDIKFGLPEALSAVFVFLVFSSAIVGGFSHFFKKKPEPVKTIEIFVTDFEKNKKYYKVTLTELEDGVIKRQEYYYGLIGEWYDETSRRLSKVFSYNMSKRLDAIIRKKILDKEIKDKQSKTKKIFNKVIEKVTDKAIDHVIDKVTGEK